MSIKNLFTIGFVTYALVLSGCFSTDSDDDDKDDNPIDTIVTQTALDSLAELYSGAEIDSSMVYTKSGSSFSMWETGSTDGDTTDFTVAISGNTATLSMSFVEDSDTIKVTMVSSKVLGTGATFDGTAWKLTSVTMNGNDTSAAYTLLSTETVVFYLSSGKAYMIEHNINMDDIFNSLASQIFGTVNSSVLDTLAVLAGSTEIDSSMVYTKSGSTFNMWESNSTDADTMKFTVTVSGSNATQVMTMVEGTDTITLSMQSSKVSGAGSSYEDIAWQLTSATMTGFDTSASVALADTEIVVFYFSLGKLYMVENGTSMNDIFSDLGSAIMGVDPIDSAAALDTLSSLVTSGKIDSMMTFTTTGDTITMIDSSDTIKGTYDVSGDELTITIGMSGVTIKENFKLLVGDNDIEGGVWILTSLDVTVSDSTVSYNLSTNEVVGLYLNNGNVYSVNENFDFEDIVSDLIEQAEGYGTPTGTWYVKYYETTDIWNDGADTNYYSDSIVGDTVYTIMEITSSSLKTYDYDDSAMVIEVIEGMIDVTAGGKFDLDYGESMTVKEKNGTLIITLIEDFTEDNGSYSEEKMTCEKYTGTIPPTYWLVDTTLTDSAITLLTDGTVDSGSIDTTDEVHVYKFTAEAGKVYQIVSSTESDSSDVDITIYNMNGVLKDIVTDGENEVMIKAESNITYYIDVSSYDDSIDYKIYVKAIEVVATPTGMINNWYCSNFPDTSSSSLAFEMDSSLFYATLTADSITVYMMNKGLKEQMKDAIYFASGNKCYFFGDEFSYTLSGSVMTMVGSDMGFVWKVFTGTSFPPEKYVDFGLLQEMMGGRYRLFK